MGIASTGWPAVRDKCRDLGIAFDAWQDGVGRLALAKRADGKYAAGVGGVVLSIPRQVGKTFTVGAMVFALCILFPSLTVVWTAHRTRTAGETFRAMQGMAKRRKIAPHVAQVFMGSGDEEIRFRNGSRILFGARERGFGRGFAEVDVEVFDEAQILTEKALDDMVPATNQSKQPTGALLFFIGTPPRPIDPGEAFTAKRVKALAGKSPDTLYIELSADRGAQPQDRKQWAVANPSYPHRTPVEAMQRMLENLSAESFLREGLGIWDEDTGTGALSPSRWAALADPDAERGEGVVFGVDVAEDRSTWVAVAWQRPDGARQVQLIADEPVPAHELVGRCVSLSASWGGVFVPPRAFEADLEREGLVVQKLTAGDFPGACGDVFDAVQDGSVRHGNQKALNDAVRVVRWHRRGTSNERAWELKDAPEVGPLVAATRALYGLSVGSVPQVHEWPDDDELADGEA